MGAKKYWDIYVYSWVILCWNHLEPLEPKGEHPFVIVENKMEDIKKNYRTLEDIEAELKNVDHGNFLDFDF